MYHPKVTLLSFLVLSVCVTVPRAPASVLFKHFQTYDSASGFVRAVAVADLNGDGKLDIVLGGCSGDGCVDGSNGIIQVMLGNGDGTFQAAQTYDSGALPPDAIAIADINHDGKPDLIVAASCPVSCPLEGMISVLLGKGDASFQVPQTYSTGGHYPLSLAIADVNRDGKLDVVAVHERGYLCCGIVGVLLGNGDGSFEAPVMYDGGGPDGFGVAVGDFNRDGKPDLVVGTQDDVVGILAGNGDGTFQNVKTYAGGGGPVAVTDVNGDGRLDVIAAVSCPGGGCAKDAVGILLGNGDGSFQAIQHYNSGGEIVLSIATADVNRDRKPDVVAANYCLSADKCLDGTVGVLLGNGDGSLQKVKVSSSSSGNVWMVALGDVNGDDKLDLVFVSSNSFGGNGAVEVWLNTTFWATTTSLFSSPNPSKSGQLVTLTATVTSTGWITPTGTVVFKNSGAKIGQATLNNGVAVFQTAKLPVGTLSLTAKYLGDVNSAKSTSPVLIQVVNP